MFNDNEKKFIAMLEKAKAYVNGELELNCNDGEWYAMDYRENWECAVPIEVKPYDKPLITDENAEENNINIVKCCEACGIYYVG